MDGRGGNRWYRRRRDLGLCLRCGKQTERRVRRDGSPGLFPKRCRECQNKENRERSERRAAKLQRTQATPRHETVDPPREWPEVLTPREAASYMRVSMSTFYRILATGQLPTAKYGDGRSASMRIKRAWIDRWLDERSGVAD